MSVRVIHLPCGRPVDLTVDNRIVEPDTDQTYNCPGTSGAGAQR